jgi:orotate phosphoribosyltransferase
VATSILHASAAAGDRKDAFVVRKAGKAHGLQQRIEGPSIQGRRVVIVEDTSTTGASPLEAANAAREAGAEVVAVATIADRATGAAEKFAEAGLDYRFVYGWPDPAGSLSRLRRRVERSHLAAQRCAAWSADPAPGQGLSLSPAGMPRASPEPHDPRSAWTLREDRP